MTKQNIIKPFPIERHLIVDASNMGKNKHLFPIFLECDVTDSLKIIETYHQERENLISFTAFIAHCLALAAYKHKDVNSYRKGRNQIIVFEDVDLVITQEVETVNGYFPGAVTIQAAQNCTISEIQAQQRQSIDGVDPANVLPHTLKKFAGLPQFIRRFILWLINRNPEHRKKNMGTLLLSSVGMHGDIRWFYAQPNYTLSVFLGGMTKKLQLIHDEIVVRDYLHITLMFDHDVVDAAPVARFAQDFKQLVESCTGLPILSMPQANTTVATAGN